MVEHELGVLQINESLARTGGAEAYLADLTASLLERGIKVRLCSGRQEDFEKPDISHIISKIHKPANAEIARQQTTEIMRLVSDHGLDLVHLHNVDNPEPFLSLSPNLPVLRTVHDSRLICPGEFRLENTDNICTKPLSDTCVECCQGSISSDQVRAQQARLLSLNDFGLVLTPSHYTKDQLVLNGLRRDKVQVLPLFAPLNLVENPKTDKEHSSDFLFIGRVTRTKGLREALTALSKSERDTQMTVCGAGPDLDYCRHLAKTLSLEGRVRFVGWQDGLEKSKYLASTKVVLFPSMAPESFGLVGLEAMFFRKPVLAFDAGGVSEWLANGQNGLLVEHGNTQQMAEYMAELVLSQARREDLGNTGRLILDKNFSLVRHLSALTDIYSMLRR